MVKGKCDGPKTADLARIITKEKLAMLLEAYHFMKTHAIPKESVFPLDEADQITKSLRRLQRKGWLREKDIADIVGLINRRLALSQKNDLENTILDHSLSNQRGTLSNDIPLAILTLSLVAHLEKTTGKRHLALINDYLAEQGIHESQFKGDLPTMDDKVRRDLQGTAKNLSESLGKRLKRLSERVGHFQVHYNSLREKTRTLEAVEIDRQQTLQTRYHLPSWEFLMAIDGDPDTTEVWSVPDQSAASK